MSIIYKIHLLEKDVESVKEVLAAIPLDENYFLPGTPSCTLIYNLRSLTGLSYMTHSYRLREIVTYIEMFKEHHCTIDSRTQELADDILYHCTESLRRYEG